MRTIPMPIVTWETVVSLVDPLRKPTRQRLRTLKANQITTNGVLIKTRRGGRASGSATYYSAITALAGQIAQAGDAVTASKMRRAGELIEKSFEGRLQVFLADHPMDDLPSAQFYDELIKQTAAYLDLLWLDKENLLIAGQIKAFRNGNAEIVDVSTTTTTPRVDLPESLVAKSCAKVGDFVWVLRRLIESAAVLTVLPAVGTGSDAREETTLLRDALAEQDEGKAYLTTGPGAPINQREIDFFAALDPNLLPTAQVVRPAG